MEWQVIIAVVLGLRDMHFSTSIYFYGKLIQICMHNSYNSNHSPHLHCCDKEPFPDASDIQ